MCRPKIKKAKVEPVTVKNWPKGHRSVVRKAPRMLQAAEKEESSRSVISWLMPLNLSQSKFGDRKTPSNACTIIALHVADLLHRFDVQLPYRDENKNWVLPNSQKEVFPSDEIYTRNQFLCLPEDLLRLLLNAIINGNMTHEVAVQGRILEVKKDGKESGKIKTTFTVPQAVDEIRKHYDSCINEIDWVSVEGNIERHLPNILRTAIDSPHLAHMNRLYFVVIAVERAIMIAYNRETETVALFDSHSHIRNDDDSTEGGAVACASAKQLNKLVRWMAKVIYPELKDATKNLYEVSCMQVTGPPSPTDAPNVVYPEKLMTRIFRKHGQGHHVGYKKNRPSSTSQSLKRSRSEAFDWDSSGSDNDWELEVILDEIYEMDSGDEDDLVDDRPWDVGLVECKPSTPKQNKPRKALRPKPSTSRALKVLTTSESQTF